LVVVAMVSYQPSALSLQPEYRFSLFATRFSPE